MALCWLESRHECNDRREGRSGLCVILLHFTFKLLPGDRRPAILVGGGHRYEQKAVADFTHNKLWVNDVKAASPRREPLHEEFHASPMTQAGQRNCHRLVCLLVPNFLARASNVSTIGCLLACVPWLQLTMQRIGFCFVCVTCCSICLTLAQ